MRASESAVLKIRKLQMRKGAIGSSDSETTSTSARTNTRNHTFVLGLRSEAALINDSNVAQTQITYLHNGHRQVVLKGPCAQHRFSTTREEHVIACTDAVDWSE
jgi:hypothetical protein